MICPACSKKMTYKANFGNYTCPTAGCLKSMGEHNLAVIEQALAAARADALEEAALLVESENVSGPGLECDAYVIERDLGMAAKIRAMQPRPAEAGPEAKYCPDCERETLGRSGPPGYELHRCAEHGILFDSQLDERPGQTKGAPKL